MSQWTDLSESRRKSLVYINNGVNPFQDGHQSLLNLENKKLGKLYRKEAKICGGSICISS